MKKISILLMGVLLSGTTAMAQDVATGMAAVKNLEAQIKSNPSAAAETADNLSKEYKKTPEVIAAIGQAYLQAKKVTEAQKYADLAMKKGGKSAALWTLKGDIAVENNDPGTAAQCYETAINFDKKYTEAYIKYSDIYRVSSPTLANQKLRDLLAENPGDDKVMRKIAQVASSAGNFKEAADEYAKIDPAKMTESDYNSYIFALWREHQYDKGIEVATACHNKNPRSAAFNRLLLYLNTDKQNYAEGEKAGYDLFNNSDDAQHQYLDYTYYGYALNGQKKYVESIPQFKKAFELDSTRTDALTSISDAYETMENYNEAIKYYKMYMGSLKPEELTLDKYFQLGKLNYEKGSNVRLPEPMPREGLKEADSLFAKVEELAPTMPQGSFWRARTNAALDPDSKQALAKPYYEKTLQIINGDKTKNISLFVECYRYLGYLKYLANDTAGAKATWSKILEVDPENEWAKSTLKQMK